ncbi:GTP-binding protein [Geminicoccus flavidas]|uniref:GTP-binding protein n=1 Tax=Geminicoccus flavidas TaxID=2506407 RepID=UPI00135C8D4C|nr:GTP-binding protein [Geminicoccus flavidas]
MLLRVFHAPSASEAIARVAAELGEQAVIIATREDRTGVSVTAAAPDPGLDLDKLLRTDLPEPDTARIQDSLRWHETAPELVQRLLAAVRAERWQDPVQALGQALQAVLPFGELTASNGVLMVVGPNGAGKSVTVAKLATALVLADRRPRVLSADGAKAGGLAQLADLLRPLQIQPSGLDPRAFVAGEGERPLLVDSQGVNPFQSQEMMWLAELAGAMRAELLLVLPAGLSAGEAGDVAGNFAAIGCRRMVISRLDNARRLGGVLAAAEAGPALAAAGIGPVIGSGLKPLTAVGLARLLMSKAELGDGR